MQCKMCWCFGCQGGFQLQMALQILLMACVALVKQDWTLVTHEEMAFLMWLLPLRMRDFKDLHRD